KERLFGLSNAEGNHGEDVKEYYFYLDNTPTHSYMRFLYKYPQAAFPYGTLVRENARRTRQDPEFELAETGVFAASRYFDVQIEYAKAEPEDILIRVTVTNRGPDDARLHVLPTIWFRNIWTWHPGFERPLARAADTAIVLSERAYGQRWLHFEGAPDLLFTENETNRERLFNQPSASPFTKDAFHRFLIDGERGALNPARQGTKAAIHLPLTIAAGASVTIRLRLNDQPPDSERASLGTAFADVFALRKREADDFYAAVVPASLSEDAANVMRQALAGLLWSKQYYHYIVKTWLDGDPGQPAPPAERLHGRNSQWTHLYNSDVISMPDKWEYPWYAAWDLAFHCVAVALVDPDFAKEQLLLLLREWYMHPNGQLPAYEWSFGDVNPPVHAWAALRVFQIERKRRGTGDRAFLERIFQKLLLNFTWWVNRKDADGMNVFQGGFLGLDNIGVFDRSKPLPMGGYLEQSDGTSWMAMYCLNMLAIAMELASENHVYEDVASKFWEHFLNIAHAMAGGRMRGDDVPDLWDDEDGFFYDVLHGADGSRTPLRVRSLVGLIPLLAVQTLDSDLLERLPAFHRRMAWFVRHRPDLTANVACMETRGMGDRRLMAILDRDRLARVLQVMLDEHEFLSPYGIRSISAIHRERPYSLIANGVEYRVDYEPAESTTNLFGGNSNWRGPIWFPINFLLIEALQRFHYYYGDTFTVECPTGSGVRMTLDRVAADLSQRLSRIFLQDESGRRPLNGANALFQQDPAWRHLVEFHEYFHGDTGAGLGASHQTGWTALIAKLLQQGGWRLEVGG
ncbi:MAG TPA: hypothetical protein VNR64_03425, partial [Vicinamibacterales bacterium]|nr:hypothetical protein [Vicinamibacterales bacterium]